ncbi:PREDICTED: PDZ domain-containing protein GIPC3 [Nicrophorus vespilloides]|uniref:PDZ domain-containing protein GIPC3 n=1 Tax=Nicrophorus vespilloides TaxID=110193 RepID=A0ABM1NIW5_NICVS|nr:PREDICTED: PDZ domain-containing protein GIPC3 [Nicrophorus vespilloides]
MFKKNRPKAPPAPSAEYDNNNGGSRYPPPQSNGKSSSSASKGTKLVFNCQLADGSPTGFVSGFSNVKELYEKIAEEFDIPTSEILFCTLNTYKLEMKELLAGQIGLEDFIFAHRKGRAKEVELVKSEDALGLTITDNGAGFAFIKRIKDGSVIDKILHIHVGDHIEKLNGVDMVGKRHHEVAKMLKEIPLGSRFTIRLVEPLRSGFNSIGPKTGRGNGKKNIGNGKGTLRFKADGNAEIVEQNDQVELGIEKINSILESYLGINDSELARQIWDMAENKLSSMDFATAIDDSDLETFGFSDELIIECWGVFTDARDGRLK